MDLRILCLFALVSVISARWKKETYRGHHGKCPHGFFRLTEYKHGQHRYTENCYRFSTERTSWHVARLECQEQGAYLALIESQEESDAITKYLTRTLPVPLQDGDHDYWIGVQDIVNEGIFREDTTNDIIATPTNRNVSFTNWEFDEPNQSGPDSVTTGADCVRLNNIDKDGGSDLRFGWGDWDCNDPAFFYLCEATPGKPFKCNTEL